MKKIITIMLAAVMLLTLSVSVFAAEPGSITINNISTTNTYDIYCILDLESYNNTTGAYSYKVNSAWTGFFATPEALAYVAIDGADYVTWTAATDDETVATFAKLALAYAKANAITPTKSSDNPGEFVVTGTTGKFSDLPLGYYLIDSTVGALCGLTTTNPNGYINVKNGIPVVEKQVLEDSTNQWGVTNTAQIGQEVEFRVTIYVHEGAENYVLHDKMSAGLTFKEVTKVTHITGIDEHTTPTTKYDVVTTGLTDDCTFEVRFTQEFCDDLETNDKVIVYYSAILNENAIIALDGNPNGAKLSFGEENETTWDETKTYAFGFDVIKTDSQNNLIDGAEFKIYDAATGGNEIKVVKMADGNYRPAIGSEVGESIVVMDGKVRVVGFDNGIYYLEETVSPAGYNKLTSRQKFIISDANLDSIFNDGTYVSNSGVHVVNKTGNMLPETGGVGTVIFVVLGSIAVLGTGVVLFTTKRFAKIAE